MKKQKYDIVYSLGYDCACAQYMQSAQIRICSGPFDWLTNADFQTRLNLILNDFENFLEFDDLKFLPKNQKMFNDPYCDYYENTKNGFYYYHEFKTGENLADLFNKIKEKYDRRIKRFNENLRTKEKVLLIYFSHYPIKDEKTVNELCKAVCKKFNKTIDFLIIEYDENKKDNEIENYKLDDNITIYKLNTRKLDKEGNLTVPGNKHLVRPIFKKYELILPLKTKIKRKILFNLSKIICPFIFNKKTRAKVKNYLRR